MEIPKKIEMGVMSELDYTIGLSGYKRIIRLGRIKDAKKLRSYLRRLQLKICNLEESAEKGPKDVDYIEMLKRVASFLEQHITTCTI